MRWNNQLLAVLLVAGMLGVIALAWSQQVENQPDTQADKQAEKAAADKPADEDKAEAEKQPAKATSTKEDDDEDERVRLEWADSMFRDKAAHTYYLKGNVRFSHKDVVLYCDEAEYYDEDHPDKPDTAKCVGNLKIVDPEATITGDLIAVDFDAKLAVITANVRIVAQKKDEEEEATSSEAQGEEKPAEEKGGEPGDKKEEDKEPERLEDYAEKLTTITCEKVEYYYDDDVKKGIATGNVKAVQEDKTAWADQAVYERIPDEITLTGNVRLKTDEGDEFHSPTAVISIEEDWIRAENVSGITFHREEEEETEEQ